MTKNTTTYSLTIQEINKLKQIADNHIYEGVDDSLHISERGIKSIIEEFLKLTNSDLKH